MCRLLAFMSSLPLQIKDLKNYLYEFRKMSEPYNEITIDKGHSDGWGIGWYEDQIPYAYREARPALYSHAFEYLMESGEAKSKIIIAHLRAEPNKEKPITAYKCHPFVYEKYLFAHNGQLFHNTKYHVFFNLNLKFRERIINMTERTQSEVFFYWIVQHIEVVCRGLKPTTDNIIVGIRRALEEIIHGNYSGLNFILSDGLRLFAFRYSSDYHDYYAMWWRKDTLCEHTNAVVISSVKLLSNEGWQEIKQGELLIVNENMECEVLPLFSG